MSNKAPSNIKEWIEDIRDAYHEATNTFTIYQLSGEENIQANELWKMTPHLTLKRRQLEISEATLNQAEVTIESTLEENRNEQEFDILDYPIASFSLCYLAGHYAFSLVEEDQIDPIMKAILDEIETNEESWYPNIDS